MLQMKMKLEQKVACSPSEKKYFPCFFSHFFLFKISELGIQNNGKERKEIIFGAARFQLHEKPG